MQNPGLLLQRQRGEQGCLSGSSGTGPGRQIGIGSRIGSLGYLNYRLAVFRALGYYCNSPAKLPHVAVARIGTNGFE